MAFCKLVTVLVLIHNIGGLLGAEVGSSIIGGRNAAKGKWPWMVHINITDEKKTQNWRCGGTILNKQWVLTAASCWDPKIWPQFSLHRTMVWIGAHNLQNRASRYMGVESVVSHYYYKAVGSGYVNDIALVRLKKQLKDSEGEVVSLSNANANFDGSSDCWITGWGNVGKGVPLPDPETLQELKIPIASDDDCKAAYPGLTSDMLCAGDRAGGKDACVGDYGGPLMCSAGGGYVQVGIMSYGSCGSPNRPGVYTKVSSYLSFIKERIRSTNEGSAEA